MTRQMILDLPVRAASGVADFLVAPSNAPALAAVEAWRAWPLGRFLVVGAPGSGRSHLARVWAAMASGARVVEAAGLAGADLPALATGPLVVEDVQALAGGAEAALFHLVNMMEAAGQPLLMTATAAPRDWGLRLPDLQSRMEATAIARLDPPCDALLSAVLVKLFADRQVEVSPAVISWLARRIERSLGAARDAVARLDAEALARQVRVTTDLARKIWPDQGVLPLDSDAGPGEDADPRPVTPAPRPVTPDP